MGKSFSDMTPLEGHVNRARQRQGLSLDWTEEAGVRHLRGREGEVTRAAVMEHVQNATRARQTAAANEKALALTLARLGIKSETTS